MSSKSAEVSAAVRSLGKVFTEQANCKSVEVVAEAKLGLAVKPQMASLGKKFRSEAKAIAERLSQAPADGVKASLDKKGFCHLAVGRRRVKIGPEDVSFTRKLPANHAEAESPLGVVVVDATMDDELLSEGLAKELVRRIQDMRKEMDLNVNDYIEVSITGPADQLAKARRQLDYIAEETRAKQVNMGKALKGRVKRKTWKLEEDRYAISIKRAG